MVRRVLTQLAEDTTRIISSTYADYLASRTRSFVVGGGPGAFPVMAPRGRLIDRNAGMVARENCYLRIMSAVENFVDSALARALRSHVPIGGHVLSVIVDTRIMDGRRGGPERKDLAALVAVPLSEFADWERLNAAVDVRNAIAHGLGVLTDMQRSSTKAVNRVRKMGVRVDGSRLVLTEGDLSSIRDVAVAFVGWLDQRA